ncbi:hypothetical protein B0H14DRAFT_2603664 [Mycena olivaceomarginata]|nr:hypothetical protein B0H14DRAFT_2603664 [Mycena olivaceomarginata]
MYPTVRDHYQLLPSFRRSDVSEAVLDAKGGWVYQIVASLAVLLFTAVNASPAGVTARQEQGFPCNADGTVHSQWKSWWPALPRLKVASKEDVKSQLWRTIIIL